MKTIKLTQGKVALVDDADYESVSQFKWHAVKDGRTFYAARNIRKLNGKWRIQRLHCFLMPGVTEIHHLDGNGLNNQRENLRSVTHQQNHQGVRQKKSGATSKFRGVCWNKNALKWQSQIRVDGKLVYLGLFNSDEDAARAYDAAARIHFKFPHFNFP